MGSLPRERVTPARSFLHSEVDYAGPILLWMTKGRAYKAFIAIFVCLTTRAVHLEVASDYYAFLAALQRFISRRGVCGTIRSDCGPNFVGADSQLRALFAASYPERRTIEQRLSEEHIQWKFNPPSAPHFGGIWEAAVKSVKHHLRRALSDDPDDLAVLTPGHFLRGLSVDSHSGAVAIGSSNRSLTRWHLLQRDHFWDCWSQEYLHGVIHRPKWWNKDGGFKVGHLCLLRSEATSPTRWPLARIVRVHPSEDGQIRVVTVRSATSELTRPIAKLVLLPQGTDDPLEELPSL